jgi:hypothetical protein
MRSPLVLTLMCAESFVGIGEACATSNVGAGSGSRGQLIEVADGRVKQAQPYQDDTDGAPDDKDA